MESEPNAEPDFTSSERDFSLLMSQLSWTIYHILTILGAYRLPIMYHISFFPPIIIISVCFG